MSALGLWARLSAIRLLARVVNGHVRHAPSSYGWLNALAWSVARDSGAGIRPAYCWGVIQGAALARALGCLRMTAVEFGVAGGRGLVALERIAMLVERQFGLTIDVVGFDMGTGLPKPRDVRDLPNLYAEGEYDMDHAALRQRLQRAALVLGPIASTLPRWLDSGPAPVGFVSLDVDYYSSSVDALALLSAPANVLLPRVHLYLDDVLGLTFGDCNGERLAVAEFNASHDRRKISPVYGLRWLLPWPLRSQGWPDMMFMAHILDHERYGERDGLVASAHAPVDR